MSKELTPSMRRSVLIAALRDKSMWPDGFEWNFRWCSTCAVGLYVRMMEGRVAENEATNRDEFLEIADKLGMLPRDALNVFALGWWHASTITPEMIADRLETVHHKLELEGV